MGLDVITARAADLRARLQQRGVAVVTVEYDGYGDSGMIDSIAAVSADNSPVEIAAETAALEGLFYDILESRYYGWQDDLGARGVFRWDLATNALEHEHSERLEDFSTTLVSGWPAEQACTRSEEKR